MDLLRKAVAALALVAACGPDLPTEPDPWAQQSLDPYPNPFTSDDPLWAPQPHRDRPRAAALSLDGTRLWVALTGAEDAPGHELAEVDLAARAVRRRIAVGRAPIALALHPGGRWLVVANLMSNWLSVVDTTTGEEVAAPPVPWYTTALAFSRDGTRLYLANRWKDSLLAGAVTVDDNGFRLDTSAWVGVSPEEAMGAATADNPDEIVVAPDGTVYVGSVAGESVDVFQPDGVHPVGHIAVRSPVGGMALAGPFLVVAHIGRGVGFPPDQGVDGDEDGNPGDGTANVIFQDLQNELEVFDTRTLASVGRYTSDTICCFDYRDVDPDDPARGLRLPAPETYPPSRASFLPPRSTWIVAGALPTRMAKLAPPAPGTTRLLAIMSASDEAQRFDVDETTGALTTPDKAGALYATGYQPLDVVARGDGAAAYVVDKLGESVTVLDTAHDPGGARQKIVVGDESAGSFPATDVELGELFNAVTSSLTVDGDQSCVHCHRDGGNLARAVAMPLQANRIWGSRQVQAYRGAFDTRPWFVEAAMDEKNFFPVLNEFARKENFCCEEEDTLVWAKYPSVDACVQAPSTAGCEHVLHCSEDPPPECATRPYGSPFPTRDAFFLAAAQKLAGRATSFGDSLREAGTDRPLPLDFDGITRAIGLFLLASPRLPPNPNAALNLASARRGKRLFESTNLGCATCHPLPNTTIAVEPAFDPAGLPVRLPPVITPTLDDKGNAADLVTPGFVATFHVPGLDDIEQGPEGVHLGIPQLRGVWDRAPRFYHDGRARSLRDALLPPGHPALGPGEHGFNERRGTPDTHGSTSQLAPDDVDDLIDFLESL